MKLLLCLVFAFGFCNEIELFMDWHPHAKNQEIFPLLEDTSWEKLPLPSRIRRKLMENGWDIRSFDKDKYRPFLLSFKQIKSFQDFLHWMKFYLPQKKPIEDPVKRWVFWSLGPWLRDFNFAKAEREKMVLFMWEPCVVQKESHDPKVHKCFGKIFTWDDDLVDNEKYFKFHYPVLKARIPFIPEFENKKLCTLINGRLWSNHPKELYSEREKMIRFFEDKEGEFDLYGRYWEKRKYKNYRGAIDDKIAVLKNYKFCICYENTKDVRGYITEKIFDCFSAGVIPIYLGASNICEYVPKECFIDRRNFKDDREVYDFIKAMPKETYQRYLDVAASYLKSEKAQVFSEDHFVQTFLEIINPSE